MCDVISQYHDSNLSYLYRTEKDTRAVVHPMAEPKAKAPRNIFKKSPTAFRSAKPSNPSELLS